MASQQAALLGQQLLGPLLLLLLLPLLLLLTACLGQPVSQLLLALALTLASVAARLNLQEGGGGMAGTNTQQC